MRRWDSGLLKKSVFRLGPAIGDEVLLGTTLGGSQMALSMRDGFHRRIYFFGEYEQPTSALFRRLVSAGSTVFDVGANVGYFSMLSCELGAGTVHAFEPNPTVRQLLTRNAALNAGDIRVVAAACSDHAGTMPLYLAGATNTGTSSLTHTGGSAVDVDVITLDGYAEQTNARPALLKIDVEGHELEVLAGARSLLEAARPSVIAEVGEDKRDAVVELMSGYRYEPRSIARDGSLGTHGPKTKRGAENICFLPLERRDT